MAPNNQVRLVTPDDAFYREFFGRIIRSKEFFYAVCWAVVENENVAFIEFADGQRMSRIDKYLTMKKDDAVHNQEVGE